MAKDYDQMEFDLTLESERSLKDNVQKVIKFALEQIMEYDHPEQVRNRHEGYGIAAECYSSLQGRVKAANGEMQTMLKLLSNGEGDILNVVGSLYNSAAEIAVEAIKLAAQSQGKAKHLSKIISRARKQQKKGSRKQKQRKQRRNKSWRRMK